MSLVVRRTIQELVTRYTLEPSLNDVYVEGKYDLDILKSALTGTASSNLAIYPITCVDVPQDTLKKHSLSEGNKQRIIALASELAVVRNHARYICLIDRDLDHWFTEHPTIPRLRWTKYCSIESHFITFEAMNDLVIVAGNAKVGSSKTLFLSTIETLKLLYSLRLADRELNLQLSWIDARKYLLQEESSIRLNFDGYVKALLNKNCKTSIQDNFLNSAEKWRGKFSDEHRLCCRGHDFTEILAWIVSKFNGVRNFGKADVIARALVLAAKSNQEIASEVSASD